MAKAKQTAAQIKFHKAEPAVYTGSKLYLNWLRQPVTVFWLALRWKRDMSSAVKTTYWPGIDGLRTVAFLLVFFHHSGKMPGVAGFSGITDLLNQFCAWGWLGVDLFFVISGFLITSLLLKEMGEYGSISLPLFYARRVLRIWPPYFTVIILACFFVPLLHSTLGHHFGTFLKQAGTLFWPYFLFVSNMTEIISPFCRSLGMPDIFGIDAIIAHWKLTGVDVNMVLRMLGPTWSLCIEEQFYIFWPVCLIISKTVRTRLGLLYALIGCSVALRLFLQIRYFGHTIWYLNTFAHMDPLMIGALLANYNHNSAGLQKLCAKFGALIFAIALTILAATIYSLPDIGMNSLWMTPSITWCAAAFAALVACTCYWPPCQKLFSNKILTGFGKKTYTMYLWHNFCLYQVFKWTEQLGEGWSSWVIRFVLSLIFTYLVALLSWTILEAPMNKLKNKFAHC